MMNYVFFLCIHLWVFTWMHMRWICVCLTVRAWWQKRCFQETVSHWERYIEIFSLSYCSEGLAHLPLCISVQLRYKRVLDLINTEIQCWLCVVCQSQECDYSESCCNILLDKTLQNKTILSTADHRAGQPLIINTHHSHTVIQSL